MKNSVTVHPLESRVLLSAGELDTSFGSQGTTSLNLNGQWNAIAALPDGGFVVAGNIIGPAKSSSKNSRDAAIIVARYAADGTIDSTFGKAGVATFDFGGGADEAEHVMVRSDGRIIVGGKCDGVESTIRLTVSGALDPTFAKSGILKGFFASAMQPDGDLLGTSGFIIQRRSPKAGLIDSTFGSNGAVNFLTSMAGFHNSTPAVFTLQPDGKILIGALFGSKDGEESDISVTRLLPSGQPDAAFATNGVYSDSSGLLTLAMSLTPDGKIVLDTSDAASEILELSAAGAKINSFSYFIDRSIVVTGMTINADGRIDLLYQGDDGVAQIQQLLPDGSPDIRFDAGDIASLPDAGFAIATQSNSHLLVAGLIETGKIQPAVYQMVTESPNQPIVRLSHRNRVVIYGTPAADHIAVSHTSTNYKFSINGVSQTYRIANVERIYILADAGNDQINIDAHGADSFVTAGAGNDTVTILSGDDAVVDGGDGNDSINGAGIDPPSSGGLFATGGAGNDSILGSHFDDNIEGNSGNDTIDGNGNTNDGLFGGSGNDLLLHTGYATRGQAGNDTLVGSGDGGPGQDTYYIRDGRHETLVDDDGQNFAQIDDSAKVKDTLNGNFKLIP